MMKKSGVRIDHRDVVAWMHLSTRIGTSRHDLPASPVSRPDGWPRVLMLGMGWFPATLGGLNRYYRALFEQLPDAAGVVIGPAEDAPATVRVVDDANAALTRRLLDFRRAARRALVAQSKADLIETNGSGRSAAGIGGAAGGSGNAAGAVELIDAHFALYAAAPLLSLAARGRPVVFHFHGPWAQESLAAGDGSRVAYAMRAVLERVVLHRADAHVVLSSAFRRVLVERYRVPPWEVHVWAPGVALELFTPGEHGDRAQARTRLNIDRQAFAAVCVRRLVPRMGLDVLLDAWERIGDELPRGSQLLIVGDGPLRESLRERAQRVSLAGRVQVLGRLPEEELIEAYRAADVAIVPSVSLEGFGLVVPEAAACGTPSIVSDVGGLPEVVAPLDRSLIVAGGDARALGERIAAAARGELPARSATRSFAEGFSWAQLAERHRALYRRLVSGERDERLRVVYVDHVARLSGGEIQLTRLLPRLEHAIPHVILGEDGPLADRLAQLGVSVEILPLAPVARELRREVARPGGASPLAAAHTLTYIAKLSLRLRALRPDLVHTNSLKAGVYGSLAAKIAGVPVVWHVRDRIAEDYIPPASVRLVRFLVSHLADGVIANSNDTLQTLPADVRGELSWVIPAAVDPPPDAGSPQAPQRDGRPDTSSRPISKDPPGLGPGSSGSNDSRGASVREELTFGMLGRIAPWKGQDLFLRAFATAFPGGGERAVIVGAPMFGEEDYERDIQALAARLGIAERVEFRGFREDVWPELASMDVLVHASLIPEPFGTVVLEGMAAGLAVIAPDEGGPATVIVDGETGRLFESRERDSLAAAMRALAADPAERRRLGDAARLVAEDYDPRILAVRLERAYESVLATHVPARARGRMSASPPTREQI
jgi:glycosyltransferase involved in cell wall biosynthesis